jgi:FlaA1/EpsC-like NDP-sugar epimerase
MFKISDYLLDELSQKVRLIYERYSVPRGLVFIADNLAVGIAFLFAYLLRFNFIMNDFDFRFALSQSFLALIIYTISSVIFRSYSGVLRYTTVEDILKVFLSTSYSCAVLILISLLSRWLYRVENLIIPISIIIIHYITITALLVFIRINIKIIYNLVSSSLGERKRVLVFGAGEMGVTVKRAMQSDEKNLYEVGGFLDDKGSLQGKKLEGVEIFSPVSLSPSFILKYQFDVLVIAINKITAQRKREIMETALGLGLEILEPPPVENWLNGLFQVQKLQKVKIEALLGRDPIRLNLKKIEMDLNGKVIMVTGAAGSIGSEIVRQLTNFRIGKLILVDQSETAVFLLGNELKKKYSRCQVEVVLADITNLEKMESVFQQYYPEIVFHAAAYKHVPLMEENPHEAIRVNVGGTKLLTGLSMRFGVKKFVMISTDKAVNPTNVMGATKRICEMILQYKAGNIPNSSRFIITRFGNVLGSNGSVIPIFRKQIEEGGPVTVTHPEMTRYFMTIPEACQLVLEAGCMAEGGEIFVFDMGKPVKIAELAAQMIRLSGLIPGKDINIEYTGLRPGEKLYEELFSDRETTKSTYNEKIRIASVERLTNSVFLSKIDWLLDNLYTLSKNEVVNYCHELVPEYKTSNGVYSKSPEAKQPV